MAKKSQINKAGEPKYKVRGTPAAAVVDGPFRVPQVRPLPDLPPRDDPRGRSAGLDEGELVREAMLTDPIADMLTRIRNANTAMHDEVLMPSSKQKVALARDPPAGGLHH